MSHNLDFLFSFVSRYLFPLWFLQWSFGWLVTCCLDFSCLCFLQLYSYIQFVVSEHCIWKTNTQYDFSFLKFREGSLKPLMWFILEKFPCALEKGECIPFVYSDTYHFPLSTGWLMVTCVALRWSTHRVWSRSFCQWLSCVHAVLACPEVSQHWHLKALCSG